MPRFAESEAVSHKFFGLLARKPGRALVNTSPEAVDGSATPNHHLGQVLEIAVLKRAQPKRQTANVVACQKAARTTQGVP